ncbi:MAG TPA: hypothetical protein VFJ43_18170 [Bacteroidia bacterium]|nr:hypothetical protein [Bacteroidia bacterium]
MESTVNQTRVQEKVQAQKVSTEGIISKKAVIGFITGATIVFGAAIYYCYSTDYAAVAGILTGAYALVCIYGASVYKSFK